LYHGTPPEKENRETTPRFPVLVVTLK